jgi:FAD:protein FMN transferase
VARSRVDELERRWSRFRADSEITRLNARPGLPTGLSADSYLLVERAIAGWRWTSGLYDPTVLRAIEDAGYDRSFEQIGATGRHASAAPGCSRVVLDPHLRTVTLPRDAGFDPGGIGKGLAADLVVALLMAEGADGACVSLGGDGRVAGEPPPGGWRVGVGNPYGDDEVIAVLTLTDHGIATSSRLMRRWTANGAVRHHLLDPRTGDQVDNGTDTVTVIAREAWMAEVLSKAVFVGGPDVGAALLARSAAAGIAVSGPNSVQPLGPLAAYLSAAAVA